MPKYPIAIYDEQGRLKYIDENGVNRKIYLYWEDTKVIKVMYEYFGNDIEISAYNKVGKNVILYKLGLITITLPTIFKTHNMFGIKIGLKLLGQMKKMIK